VRQGGFFQNYDSWTWTAICLQAFGGLVIAAVIKYGWDVWLLLGCLGAW
jgi:UDP-sugar transporter A1/2/3